MTAPIRTVAAIGTGVIGRGWVSLLLARGLDVVAWDPAARAEQDLRTQVEQDWPALRSIGLADGASPDRLRFAAGGGDAAAGADFVQESGPEREDLKRALLTELDEAAASTVVIASSSSGIMPSHLQLMCRQHPERVVVGHPFHPSHLMPLVEVVPGAATDERHVETAVALYERLGKRPIRLRHEVVGHVANRLQAALWREAYSLVERGIVSVADVDAAVSYGPGLRWSLLGPLVNQHLSGGDGGLAHTLEHLGPPAQTWMDDLRDVQLTPALAERLVAGVDDELAGIDQTRMVQGRDELLIHLLAEKKRRPDIP